MTFQVREYLEEDGRSPFRRWFLGLPATVREGVDEALRRMELGNLGDTKSLGGGLHERRIHHGAGYRLYFGREGPTLILLVAGGTKRRQQRDIERARERWVAYKRRRREEGGAAWP